MGLILDSSVAISAERRSESVVQLLRRILSITGDQQVALSAVQIIQL